MKKYRVKGDITFLNGLLANPPNALNLQIYTDVLLGYDWNDKNTVAYPLYTCLYLQKNDINVIGKFRYTEEGRKLISKYFKDIRNISYNAEWHFFGLVEEYGLTVPDDLRRIIDMEIDGRLKNWLGSYFGTNQKVIDYYKTRYKL